MIIEVGDRILACHRRLFEQDEPRFFVGEVLASDDSLIKVSGFSFGRDPNTGHIVRKNERRSKLIPVVAGTYLLYQLPDAVDVERLHFAQGQGQLVLTDDGEFRMDLSEHSPATRF